MFKQIVGKTSHVNFHKNLPCGSYPVTYLTNGRTERGDMTKLLVLQLLCGFIERLGANLTIDLSMMHMCLFKSQYQISECGEVESFIRTV